MSGPDRKGVMSLDLVTSVVSEASALGCRMVNLTGGGDPFALGSQLKNYVGEVSARVPWVRVTTSGFWAGAGRKSAVAALTSLAAAGLRDLALSTSAPHLEFVSLETLAVAVSAAHEANIATFIQIAVDRRSSDEVPREVAAFLHSAGVRIPAIVVVPVVPAGRASAWDKEVLLARPYRELAGPCPSVQRHLMVHPNGDVTGCSSVVTCNSEAFVHGSVHRESLRPIMERIMKDPSSVFIRKFGVVALRLLLEKTGKTDFVDEYVNICHLCRDIFSGTNLNTLSELGLLADRHVSPAVPKAR
jgi:MoaA/NifB/PqqE/SkfB family radical SAM enzyme